MQISQLLVLPVYLPSVCIVYMQIKRHAVYLHSILKALAMKNQLIP